MKRFLLASTVLLVLALSISASWATIPTYSAEYLPNYIIPFGHIENGAIPLSADDPNSDGKVAAIWTSEDGLHIVGPAGSEGSALGNRFLGGNLEKSGFSYAAVWNKQHRTIQLTEEMSHLEAIYDRTAVGDVWNGDTYVPAIWRITGVKSTQQTLSFQGIFADINSNGLIVGHGFFGEYPDDYYSAFVYRDGEAEPLFSSGDSWIYDLNDLNIACGSELSNGNSLGIRFDLNGEVEKEYLPNISGWSSSVPVSINNQGQIVGFVQQTANSAGYACLWQDGQCLLLQNLMGENDWRIYYAYSIDDQGRIVALGYGPGHLEGIMVLTPVLP